MSVDGSLGPTVHEPGGGRSAEGGADAWTESAAVDRYLEDLEADETAAELVRARLEGAPASADEREGAYRRKAEAWLERGRPRVALALLDRGTGGRLGVPNAGGSARSELPIDALLARIPGVGGLPALTDDEAQSLRDAATPEHALAVVRRARRRLESHGEEARRLLNRWIDRQR